MANELRALRLNKKIPAKDIVAVVQKLYPSFDNSLLSKIENPDKYGVTLNQDAANAVIDAFAPTPGESAKQRQEGRPHSTCRITCQLENDEYALLQQLIRAGGHETTQDFLSKLIKDYIKTHKSKGANQ